MAKSKARSMKKYDTERFLKFNLTCTPETTWGVSNDWDAHYIDLAWCMSAINRRLYRQGKVYHINNIYIHDSQGDCEIRFLTAPNTWVTRAAWNLGFKNWKKQRALALEAGSTGKRLTGRYSDFKVFLDGNHIQNEDSQHGEWKLDGSPENQYQDGQGALVPIGGDGNSADSLEMGEWVYSKFYEPDTVDGTGVDETLIHLMGPHYDKDTSGKLTPLSSGTRTADGLDLGSLSLIAAMEEVYPQPSGVGDPSLPADFELAFYNQLFSTGDQHQEILDETEDENDLPPYEADLLVGGRSNLVGPVQKRAAHIASSFSPSVTVGGFSVPCGLLRIETRTRSSNTVGIVIELAAGEYKGLAAEDM